MHVKAIIVAGLIVTFAASAVAETKLEWTSKDTVESKTTRYKYRRGPAYPTPTTPGAKHPGYNYGSISLTAGEGPPRAVDRVLKRDGRITGRIVDPLAGAKTGRVWLTDNYGRVLDRVDVKAPEFAFSLSAARALHTGIYLQADLTGAGGKSVWTGKQGIRMTPAGDPWADFILGVYNMGTKTGTGEMWREMGLTHRAVLSNNSPIWPVQNDLQFHGSNIVYSLLGLYHRDHLRWRELREADKTRRGPVRRARHRCLSDPKEREFIRIILESAALKFRPHQPLHYSIGDEIGIGDMASPHDLCGSRWCMARYRRWLKERYGSVEALNERWGTEYEHWGDAKMFSINQALKRARTMNFAPWADRLEFMDLVLYDAVAHGARVIRAIDPTARCNISGVQQPSCWQFDHYLLTRVANCATPYEIGEGPDVLMSFYGDGKTGKLHSPGFGGSAEGLWRAFIRGYHLAAQWDSFGRTTYSRMIDVEKRELTELGKMYKRFADWVHTGPGRLRNRSERRRDPVAILYSQPSLRANWILELTTRPDVHDRGEKWVTRGSWSVRQRELSFRVRVSWVQWCHDIGVWPKFVDARQLGDDYLTKQGFKALILPRAVAMSDETAAAVRKFAEFGGTVIADTWCGLTDETCRIRPKAVGVLDEMFGVKRRNWRRLELTKIGPKATGIELAGAKLPFMPFETTLRADGDAKAGARFRGADVAISRAVGKGRAIYLNFRMESYFLHRLHPGMTTTARNYLARTFSDAGVKPVVTISLPDRDLPFHPAGHDICVYTNGRGYVVGVRPNPTMMHSEVGGIERTYKEIPDNVFNKPSPAQLNVPEGMWVYDLTGGGKRLGKVSSSAFTSSPDSGRLYACWPFEITGLQSKVALLPNRRLGISGAVKTSAPVKGEKLALALRIVDAAGVEQRAYRRTIDCTGAEFGVELPLALSDHGTWTITLREPCSGTEIRQTINLK